MLRKFPILIVITLSILVLISSCNEDGSSFDPKIEAQMREIVAGYKEEFELPGVLAGIWIPGKGHLIIEDGLADIKTGRPISKTDFVRIGSIAKSFTVTDILQLAGEGLLDLSDPVGKYLPGVENSDATIAELANMKSGIFNYTEDADFVTEFVESDFLKVWTDQEIVDFADNNVPYFPPGGGWHYSNTNTVILGMIVEQVTGHPLGEEIRKRIIEPPRSRRIDIPYDTRYAGADCARLRF